MRRVHFDSYRERLGRVFRARQAALRSVPPQADGRPLPDEMATLVVHALENQGPGAGPPEAAADWLEQLGCHWHEYGVALENLRLGIGPPTSGSFNNDAYGECTGGTLRADVWGFIHPGDPAEAGARAAEDATLDHFGDALDVARFHAGLVAEALVTDDLRACARAGFKQLSTTSPRRPDPKGTKASGRAALCIQSVLNLAGGERDFRRAWAVVAADWGHPEPTNVLANVAAMLLALVAGELDWRRTLEIVRATGGDVTAKAVACATVLGALGVEVPVPRLWRAPGPDDGRAGGALADIDVFKSEEDFIERLCRLAVACARPDEVEIAGAPYFPAAGPPVARPVRLVARYEGEPVIAPAESRAVFLERPHETEDIPGTLEVDSPEGLAATPMGGVTVPGKIAARVVNVSLAGSVEEASLPVPVTGGQTGAPGPVRARIVRAGRTVAEAEFGFHLARVYLAMGPFDNSDGGGLERQYLPEAKLTEKLAGWREPFHTNRLVASGDLVDVDGAFGLVGPRVIYLVRVVASPAARPVSLRVGSSGGVKLWLNGRRLLAADRTGYATPNDFVMPASLKKGANRLVIKLARSGLASTFRLRITERDSEKAVTGLWDGL